MKFLIVLALLAVVVAWVVGRQGRRKGPAPRGKGTAEQSAANKKPGAADPATMLACARCGVHLPSTDAMFDDTGRPFCGPEHRLAGPG